MEPRTIGFWAMVLLGAIILVYLNMRVSNAAKQQRQLKAQIDDIARQVQEGASAP